MYVRGRWLLRSSTPGNEVLGKRDAQHRRAQFP